MPKCLGDALSGNQCIGSKLNCSLNSRKGYESGRCLDDSDYGTGQGSDIRTDERSSNERSLTRPSSVNDDHRRHKEQMLIKVKKLGTSHFDICHLPFSHDAQTQVDRRYSAAPPLPTSPKPHLERFTEKP